MDPTQVNPEVLAMLQALQGGTPQAGMAPPNPAADPNSPMNQMGMGAQGQQASLGGMLSQQPPGVAGPLATPPPMTPPPAPIY